MPKTFTTGLLALLALGLGAWAQDNPDATIPCGEIIGMTLVDRAALTLNWDVRKFKDEPVADTDEKFAVVTVKLGHNKSIGKYDYTLGGNTCLAMAIKPNAFDPGLANWEFRNLPEAARVDLLYKVKAADDKKGFAFLYRYVDRANIYTGTEANCVNRTVSTRMIGAGSPVALPASDPNEDGKKAGTRKKTKRGKSKKAADEDEDAGEDAGDEDADDEDKPAKKKKKDDGDDDAAKPAPRGAGDDDAGDKNPGL